MGFDALKKSFAKFRLPHRWFSQDGVEKKPRLVIGTQVRVREKRPVVTVNRVGRIKGVNLPNTVLRLTSIFDALQADLINGIGADFGPGQGRWL